MLLISVLFGISLVLLLGLSAKSRVGLKSTDNIGNDTNNKETASIPEKEKNVSRDKPTIPPAVKTITKINNDGFEADGLGGKVIYPKSDKIKIFFRSKDGIKSAAFTDLEEGQYITVENIIPGESATVFIER